jgi:FG-GAP repeat
MASLEPSGTGLQLTRRDWPALHYGGLSAYDATGQELRAWLELQGESALLLHVDDTHARYPLTIDPFVQQAKLTASDGAAGDNFGRAVAIDGDTVVIGAAYAQVGANLMQGVVCVFVKPATGWTTTSTFNAKLTASDGKANDLFGYTVAINGDTASCIYRSYSGRGVFVLQAGDRVGHDFNLQCQADRFRRYAGRCLRRLLHQWRYAGGRGGVCPNRLQHSSGRGVCVWLLCAFLRLLCGGCCPRSPARLQTNRKLHTGCCHGINPVSEPVTLQIATFPTTIPAGSFKLRNGTFEFLGTIDGVTLAIAIEPLGHNRFRVIAGGEGVNLTGLANSVTVVLTIGNDGGTTTATIG